MVIFMTCNAETEKRIRSLIVREGATVSGLALRFAFQLGLTPTEMSGLKWKDISITSRTAAINGRTVPIPNDLIALLMVKSDEDRSRENDYIFSQFSGAPMKREQISYYARNALDNAFLSDITLNSLRTDYICSLLSTRGWEYVSSVTGIKYAGLKVFGKKHNIHIAKSSPPNTYPEPKTAEAVVSSYTVLPEATILRLAFFAGIGQQEMATLKWEQVDLSAATICTDGSIISIDPQLVEYLTTLKRDYGSLSDYVIIGMQKHNPLRADYISRLGKQALVSSGYPNVSLSTLSRKNYTNIDEKNLNKFPPRYRKIYAEKIVEHLQEVGPATRKDVAAELGISYEVCGQLLESLTESGKLRTDGRENSTYYLPEQASPYQQQSNVVLQYIKDNGSITLMRVKDILGFTNREQYHLMSRMERDGLVKKMDSTFYAK